MNDTVSMLLAGLLSTAAIPAPTPASASPSADMPPAASNPSVSRREHASYEFAPGDSVERGVQLTETPEGAHFLWPAPKADSWDTALLSVRSAGAEAHPWVDIEVDGHHIDQYLDANATGVRWLNLSGLHAQLAAGASVTIRTHAITLDAKAPASLRLFDNRLDLQQRILIIAPHPDDAEIAAFGLYADRQATVVTVTAGNAGDMNYRANVSDPAQHYLLKGYLRAVDSVTIPWQGNIPPERTANLGYFDGRLDTMYRTPETILPEVYGPNTDTAVYRRANLGKLIANSPRSNSWRHLVEDLAEILRKVNPALIVMPEPRLDGHLDHEFATVAVSQALEHWQGNPTFLLYTNHTDTNHYPYGPSGTVVSLPPLERDLTLHKVYSHPTPSELQIRKLFALESMHDLRLSPDEQLNCGVADVVHRPDYPRAPDEDYFRRAPRSNELFYVVDKPGVLAVVQDFLAHYTPSP